ncbi:hypothetical protein [Aquimarina sp. SS2-1]|uniref:hypothetical protein n=1 Tax=Aquimarina besae TaxID=3342247 RepID=UPI00367087EB
MKNTQRKKLSLDKIKVARLIHLDIIKGGLEDTTTQISKDGDVCLTDQQLCETSFDCGVSTKTVPVSGTAFCLA